MSRLRLTMMSACVSNRLTSFSRAGTVSPRSTRRSLCAITLSISGSYWRTLSRQSATAGVVDEASRELVWILEGWGRTGEARQIEQVRATEFDEQLPLFFDV